MDIIIIKNWANENPGFLTLILFLVSLLIAWVSGFLKWIFKKLFGRTPYINAGGDIKAGGDIFVGNKTINMKNSKDEKIIRAGVMAKGKGAMFINSKGIGPDAGIIDEGKDTKLINSEWISTGEKKQD